MHSESKISSGLSGLDEILKGGLLPQKSYLIGGGPGTGKSTFGYHFLSQGVNEGKTALYITLGESKHNIMENASQLGIDLTGVRFLDLSPGTDLHQNSTSYSVFHSSEVEQEPILNSIVQTVDEYQPQRVFLDSITLLRSISNDPYQMRKIALSFINYICENGATLLISSESSEEMSKQDESFWVDGIIQLKYHPAWRRVSISKYRGSDFMHGTHAFRIADQGIQVYPKLQPQNYDRNYLSEPLSTGIAKLDELLHGGIEKGTSTIVTGPSGVGKTNFGIQFIKEAASRGERSAVYTFEESAEVLIRRSESIGVPIRSMIDSGKLKMKPVQPLAYSPDEFSAVIRRDVEENDTRIVMIDSVGGYGISVREENTLERLHGLTVYLQNMGVTTIMIHETSAVTGLFETTGMNASYLADNIIFLRYLELDGELQKVIGVLKKRLSDFEKGIRSFDITSNGLVVGEQLKGLRGILSGMPSTEGVDIH